MLTLVMFLSACDIGLEDIDRYILENPGIIDRIDELTDAARARLELLTDSGVEEIVVESTDSNSGIVDSSSDNLVTVSGVTDEEEIVEVNDVPLEDQNETESSGVTAGSSSGGGSESSSDVVVEEPESSSTFNPGTVFNRFATTLNLPFGYDFLPGQSISGIVFLDAPNSELTSLRVRLAFNNNPDIWLSSMSIDPSQTEIVVQAVIPSSYGVDSYQRAELVWQTATSSGVYQPQWSGSNGHLLELPMTSGLSLPPYTVLLRPESVDSGLIEEPLFAYAYQIVSGVYKIPHISVIRPETVLEDGGRKWGLNMVNLGYPENGIWIETSYSGAYRGRYAGRNMYYSLEQDLFVSSLNELDPNYTPPTLSSGVTESSGVISSGLSTSGLVDSLPLIVLNCNDSCWNEKDMAIQVGQTFIDPGAVATDQFGNSLNVTVTGSVNNMQPGRVHYLRYNALDASGVSAIEVIRHVNVSGDTISNPLNVQVVGGTSLLLRKDMPYTESGITINNLPVPTSGYTVLIEGTVTSASPGLYYIYYTVTDSSGLQSRLIKTVEVREWQKPEFVELILNETNYTAGDTIQATLLMEGPQEARDRLTDLWIIFSSDNGQRIELRPLSMSLLSNEVQLYFTIPESFSGTFSGGRGINYTSSCVVLRGPDPDNDLPYCEAGNGGYFNTSSPQILINISPKE